MNQPSSASTPISSTPRAFRSEDIDYQQLLPFIDLVYGATVGYGFILLSQALAPLFTRSRPDWTVVVLLAFTVNFLIGDYVEARLINNACRYTNRRRPMLDLLVPLAFLTAFVAAHDKSYLFPATIGIVFILGAAWGAFLAMDCRGRFELRYSRMIFSTHLAAGAFAFALSWLWRGKQFILARNSAELWIVYILLSVVLLIMKRLEGLPQIEMDLASIWPFEHVACRIAALFRE